MKRFARTKFETMLVAITLCGAAQAHKSSSHSELPHIEPSSSEPTQVTPSAAPMPSPSATTQSATPTNDAALDESLEALSSFDATVNFEGDVDFTVTTANPDERQVLLEQSKYRPNGSLQSETNYFYDAKGTLLQTMQIAFDAQSHFVEYSINHLPSKSVTTIRLARNIKPNATKKPNPRLTLIAKPPSQIEGSNPNGDGTKVIVKLRADGTTESKSIKRAPIGKLGAINFVSQYDKNGLRREISAFLRDGSRRSHVILVRNAQKKLTEVQYAGAQSGTRYSYDKNGRLTEGRFMEDGKVTRRFVMRATPTGKIGEILFYDAQGLTSRELLAHDGKDRVVSASVFDGSNVLQQKTTFKYDTQSRLIDRETRDAKGQFLRSEKSEYRDGKLLKVINTNADGTTIIDNYNAKGERIKAGTTEQKTGG